MRALRAAVTHVAQIRLAELWSYVSTSSETAGSRTACLTHVVPRSRGVAHEPVGDAMELCEYFERHSGQQGDMSHVVLLSALRL